MSTWSKKTGNVHDQKMRVSSMPLIGTGFSFEGSVVIAHHLIPSSCVEDFAFRSNAILYDKKGSYFWRSFSESDGQPSLSIPPLRIEVKRIHRVKVYS